MEEKLRFKTDQPAEENTVQTEEQQTKQTEGKEQAEGTENSEDTEKIVEEKLFTQEEVNEIVKKRLTREKKKQAKEREQLKQTYREKYYNALRRKSLLDAGIPFDMVDRYMKYMDSTRDDEQAIEQQAFEIAQDFKVKPRTYVDPTGKRSKTGIWKPFN